ncbi:helix-turn-helix transcriptional regulator [Burkholderia ambifaria]|uniref:helix-turn-helix transcriptional regulator n=1 Tax=Burkholderia ambifaria TaxID=152480 RepID=UPI000F80C796|nr:autoinducer binding domain-containing protein [Burkholderia ambifaria]
MMDAESVEANLRSIMDSSDETEVLQHARQVVSACGGQWFVFSSLHPRDQSLERVTFRFLIGCMPQWCQVYNAHRWYTIDPFLEYALTNTAPIVGGDMVLRTAGQREIMDAAASYGFRSIYIVPAHGSGKGRIGLLYIGSDEERSEGEKTFSRNRFLLRSLASELLDWSSARLKDESIRAFNLDAADLKVLEFVRDGFTAQQIATELHQSPSMVYSHFKKITNKIGEKHISGAVRFAAERGFW